MLFPLPFSPAVAMSVAYLAVTERTDHIPSILARPGFRKVHRSYEVDCLLPDHACGQARGG